LYEWDFERLPEDEKQKISDNIDRNVEKIIKEFDKTKSLFLENEVDVKVNCSNCPFGLWENCVRDY
jgi:hypothetical protein